MHSHTCLRECHSISCVIPFSHCWGGYISQVFPPSFSSFSFLLHSHIQYIQHTSYVLVSLSISLSLTIHPRTLHIYFPKLTALTQQASHESNSNILDPIYPYIYIYTHTLKPPLPESLSVVLAVKELFPNCSRFQKCFSASHDRPLSRSLD